MNGKRSGAPTRVAARFEHINLVAERTQTQRTRQASNSTSDYNGPHTEKSTKNLVLTTF
jgi:hypothetical protein